MAENTSKKSDGVQVCPQLLVVDVAKTAAYWRVTFGEAHVHLARCPAGAVRPNNKAVEGITDIYIYVADADAVFRDVKTRGAKIITEPKTQPYGMRDFDIEECNGYRIAFGADVS